MYIFIYIKYMYMVRIYFIFFIRYIISCVTINVLVVLLSITQSKII